MTIKELGLTDKGLLEFKKAGIKTVFQALIIGVTVLADKKLISKVSQNHFVMLVQGRTNGAPVSPKSARGIIRAMKEQHEHERIMKVKKLYITRLENRILYQERFPISESRMIQIIKEFGDLS